MDSNQDLNDSTAGLPAFSVGPDSEPTGAADTEGFPTSDLGGAAEPPDGDGWAGSATSPPSGPRWGRRLAAAGAALVVLVGVGFAGHLIGYPTSVQQATQPIPSPAASSGVTAKSGTLNVSAVTAKVDPGVVDITAVDGYQNATSAGTGMILTSNGEVLTNNHVIDGATSITAQVDGEGTKYTAKVVGYDVTQDVALLQLQNASGLSTISAGNSSSVSVGEAVVAIGNALDLPGKPTVTSGAITALDRSITASDQGNANSENLTGLLQSDASLCPGNSGGPLANSAGQVIAMNTAAEDSSSSGDSCSTVAFSIPINAALSLASQIQQGDTSSTIHIGLPAFLGVEVESPSSASGGFGGNGGFGGYGGYTPPVSSGALVIEVVPNTAAQSAGLVAGDVITSANGDTISSPADLTSVLSNSHPGESISLTWVNSSDSSQTANVTLGTGPAA
jgi:S1-C subfamily serine protease